jgi:hypothetical protein
MLQDLYDIRAMIDLDGKYVVTAHGKVPGAQAFWFGDERHDSEHKALESPEVHELRGPRLP